MFSGNPAPVIGPLSEYARSGEMCECPPRGLAMPNGAIVQLQVELLVETMKLSMSY